MHISESQDFIKTFQKNWKIQLEFWVLSCFSWFFLLIFLNKTFLDFVCLRENAYHFLINSGYNSYGFEPRSLGTFRSRELEMTWLSHLACSQTLLSYEYLVTTVHWSSKPNIYYYCFTASMQTAYWKRPFSKPVLNSVSMNTRRHTGLYFTLLRASEQIFLKNCFSVETCWNYPRLSSC